eukprot:CAMPEP_0194289168 /NCGR_PEP_ID=MMETSP0169-20130528/38492_1 /TAXON_ID=218684 /ORGANISM="Corethron pennatum, Strain L29A3" /LENGTH=55 /DNA_ID=CAMNT_0039036377 /DNA_START=1 /DNA_END=164 /DNA_ORIENTATION=-
MQAPDPPPSPDGSTGIYPRPTAVVRMKRELSRRRSEGTLRLLSAPVSSSDDPSLR